MKAIVLSERNTNAQLLDVDEPVASAGEVIVNLAAAALNRRDFWITQDLYPNISTPVILGSDGAGTVESTGPECGDWQVGDKVVIYPAADWGGNEHAQSDTFTVLGMPSAGTFAERVKVSATQLHRKPDYLSWAETAAIPVAGITAYRALVVQGQLQPGQRVFITGIGGGVAVFALQLAVALRAQVAVSSSSPEKLERAKNLGASVGVNYREEGWSKTLAKEFGSCDVIIDGAGGPNYRDLVSLLKPGGHLVSYGSTAGRPEKLDLFKVFWRQLHLVGSTLGSPRDFAALLSLMTHHEMKPIIDRTVPLSEGPDAIAAMKEAGQFGKVTLEC